MIRKSLAFAFVSVWLSAVPHTLRADCGSVPFEAPLMGAVDFVGAVGAAGQGAAGLVDAMSTEGKTSEVRFDPLKVSVFEPQQRALILWNGQEEILLLSTDQKASEKSAVLEVIPLPSRPTVRLGSFATFEAAQKLAVEKRMWKFAKTEAGARMAVSEKAGRIDFHEKLGAHDLTVAEALNANGFTTFVQDHLRATYKTEDAPIRPEFIKIIQSYLDEGFRWFAFDVIALDEKVKSRDPIEYRFACNEVFYPLRISSLEEGKTNVDLLVFSASKPAEFLGLAAKKMDRLETIDVRQSEVEALDKTWKGFFGEKTDLRMDQWSVRDKSADLVRDIRVR